MNVLNLDTGEKGRVFCEGVTQLVVFTEDANLSIWPLESCLMEREIRQEVPKAIKREKRKKNRG